MLRITPTAVVLLSLGGVPATTQAAPPIIIPKIGTQAIPTADGATLPIDKPYAKLSYEEQKIVRSWYEHLSASDEPPFPLDGMQAIVNEVAKVQQKVHVSGRFYAAAHVDAKGHAETVSIYTIPDQRLNNVMAAILINTSYKPARCNGKPCAMDFPVDVDFE